MGMVPQGYRGDSLATEPAREVRGGKGAPCAQFYGCGCYQDPARPESALVRVAPVEFRLSFLGGTALPATADAVGALEARTLSDADGAEFLLPDTRIRLATMPGKDILLPGGDTLPFEAVVLSVRWDKPGTVPPYLQYIYRVLAGTEWLPQPAITQKDTDEGCFQPDWCVNSFALYGPPFGEKYGHIARGFLRDDRGEAFWLRTEIVNEVPDLSDKRFSLVTLRVWLTGDDKTRQWIEAARFPLDKPAGEYFGNTDLGGTQASLATTYVTAAGPLTASEDGDATAINFATYDGSYSNPMVHTLGLYDDGGGTTTLAKLKDTTAEVQTTLAYPGDWITPDVPLASSQAITSGVKYWVLECGYCADDPSKNHGMRYDAGTSEGGYKSSYTYTAPPMAASLTLTSRSYPRKISARIFYTPSGGGFVPYPHPRGTRGGMVPMGGGMQ